MSSVIVLSSPPKTFARSPTPVESSSPLPSPGTLLGQFTQQPRKKFKSTNVQRNGFSSGLGSARVLLGTKIGAENIPIVSPINSKDGLKILSPKRFKSTSAVVNSENENTAKITTTEDDPIRDEDTTPTNITLKNASVPLSSLKYFNSAPTESGTSKIKSRGLRLDVADQEQANTKVYEDPFELPGSSPQDLEHAVLENRQGDITVARQSFSPLNIDKAISRKTDWTPTKEEKEAPSDDEYPSIGIFRSFSGGLFGSFGYSGDTAVIAPASRREIDTGPSKRRRLDMTENTISSATINMPSPKTTANKKPKAAPKKALTITGVATSNYIGTDVEETERTALDQFFSTQTRALEADHKNITSEIAKVKTAKKQKGSMKAVKKSTLVSPASAIENFVKQDAMFGSASQLARDESPTLTRYTLEAIRQSDLYMFSSPIRTQDTEPVSIESTTPRAGTHLSRFTKTRGLWQAAGRGEDNALLHVDTIDIDTFDTPDLRQAFPGKDVLVQPSASRARHSRSPDRLSPLRVGGTTNSYSDSFWDIDALDTPASLKTVVSPLKIKLRTLHTTSKVDSPRRRITTTLPARVVTAEPVSANEDGRPRVPKTTSSQIPKKPSFAGLTLEKLQKQISAYGFKPIKQREEMIAVLERCWDAKYVYAEQASAANQDPVMEEVHDLAKYGDHLSNVHGLANRPVPKENKMAKPRNAKELKKPKDPRLRKKREPKAAKEADSKAPKAVRKRKSKAVLSAEEFVDLTYVENRQDPASACILKETATEANADGVIERAKFDSQPEATTNSKSTTKAASKTTTQRFATPPPTSSPAFATHVSPGKVVAVSSSSSKATIDAQIERAIKSYKAPKSTIHQREPTWHEKILMYDPIVLEDLASWLNTVGLSAIGEDREVSALEVREWCESRGICCLWRGGWRGNKAAKE